MKPQRWVEIVVLICVAVGYHFVTNRHQTHAIDFFASPSLLRGANEAQEHFPIYAGCAHPLSGVIEFRSTSIVPDDFFKRSTPEAIALRQLKYLEGDFNYDHEFKDFHVYVKPLVNVKVTRVSHQAYGRDIDFEPNQADDQRQYPESFRAAHRVSHAARATRVDFTAEQAVDVCSSTNAVPSTIPISIPYDPYLAFWLVPASERRLMSFQHSKNVTNPCADSEMADIQGPSMYWYVWNPRAAGKDASGKDYDCRPLLQPGRDYLRTEAKFTQHAQAAPKVEYEELLRQPELKIRIISGFMDGHPPEEGVPALKEFFRDGPELLSRLHAIRYDGSAKYDSKLDSSAVATGALFQTLETVIEFTKSTVTENEKSVVLNLTGQLKVSRKPVDLKIYVGPTDQVQNRAAHWSFLADALKEGDLIFYIGHSGMGTNMRMSELVHEVGGARNIRAEAATKPYQLFAVIGCYTTSYYGDDYLEYRNKPGLTSDVMLVSSRRYLLTIPALVLGTIDRLFNDQPFSMTRVLASAVGRPEMILVTRHTN